MHRLTGQGPELAGFPHDRPVSLPIPSRSVVTSHLRRLIMYLYRARWVSECVWETRAEIKTNERNRTHKVIDAYCGSKKKKRKDIYNIWFRYATCTTKMFQHDCNVILYNSSSINKKLKLSDLHFRHNIDCFCSILLMKIFQSKPQQNCFVSPSNTAVFVTERIHVFERVKWVNDSVTHS